MSSVTSVCQQHCACDPRATCACDPLDQACNVDGGYKSVTSCGTSTDSCCYYLDAGTGSFCECEPNAALQDNSCNDGLNTCAAVVAAAGPNFVQVASCPLP